MTVKGMKSFTAADWFTIELGGLKRDCAAIKGIPDFDPRTIKHDEIVKVDGKDKRVLGVETYAIINATGMDFSLAVNDPWF